MAVSMSNQQYVSTLLLADVEFIFSPFQSIYGFLRHFQNNKQQQQQIIFELTAFG